MDYKSLIIERVNGIEDKKYLKFIYELLEAFQKKWGI